jgi:predicted extracellular nuclease
MSTTYQIDISQVYGGGGNSGALYKNDFIELYNYGSTAIDLTGWSVQYASASGSVWQVTPLGGTLLPGHYYLIQEAPGSGGATALPTPDATGTIAMSATSGKVALAESTTAFSGTSPSGVIDFVGYGAAAAYEGSAAAPTLTNTTADSRIAPATDTNNNAADFASGAPNPHNSAFGQNPTVSVSDAAVAEGDSGSTTLTFTVTRSDTSTAFSVDYATADGTATAADGDYVAATGALTFAAGGPATQTISVTVNGDAKVEADETLTLTLSNLVNATGDTAISNATATGTILNDDVTLTPIYTIQGAGDTSPLVGQTVTTQGVVTAIDTNGGESSRGFYIQDATGDGNSATSDAIFVYLPNGTLPTVGDLVKVTGTVQDYKSSSAYLDSETLTEISGVASIADLGVGPAIAPVQIGGVGGLTPPTSDMQAGVAFWESLESMKVTLVAPTAVSATDSSYLETYVVVQGADGQPYTNSMNADGSLTVTGGATDYGNTDVVGGDFNPEAIQIDVDSGMLPGFAKPVVDTGAQFSDVTGIVSYAYGVYQVLATQAYSVTQQSTLQKQTTTLTGDAAHLTVASYNLENLAPTDTARIAAHASEIFNNLGAPDVVALQEIQDNDGAAVSSVTSASDTLQALVDDLNALAAAAGGGAHYSYIDNPYLNNNSTGTANGGAPGGNIRNAYIYRDDRVSFVDGSLQTIGADGSALTSADPSQLSDPNNPFYDSRPSLVATFSFNGQDVTVIDNHFSSKGGSGVLEGTDPTPLDAYEDKRAAQAQAVNTYVDNLLAANPDAKIVVAGDLNDFQFEEPLKVLEGVATVSGYTGSNTPGVTGTYTEGGTQVLTDLTTTLPAREQYDYNFDGSAEDLDHILVSDSLAAKAQFDVVHINSEFSNQTSDHDPLVTRLTICFYPGTRIATPRGARAVETLEAGDLILTASGVAAPIRWMGRQTISTRFADPLRALPIRIRAGALGDNLPLRDLLVSPDHALLIEDVLIHAGALVNGVSIVRERNVPDVFTYWHIELADHALALAEGVAAETFIDNVDRLAFDNWSEHDEANAPAPIEEMLYPRAKAARQVPQRIRKTLAARAARFARADAVA